MALEPLNLPGGVLVPADAMSVRAVRAGGPGGQNVNKVSTKVELRVDLARIQGLDEGALARLRDRVKGQLDAEGCWIVTSSRTRSQLDNLEDALEKVGAVIEAIRVPPRRRHATRPTKGSQERRLQAKKRAGAQKRQRTRGGEE